MPTVSFDPLNRELRSNWTFFAAGVSPISIQWIDGIDGAAVTPGMVLGQWLFPTAETPPLDLVAPDGCQGTVVDRNSGVAFDQLRSSPSQVLLLLNG
jgi:hypothetical protein